MSTGRFARFAYRFTEQIADPIRATRGAAGYLSYVRDWWRYRRLEPAENVPLLDLYPQVHDRRAFTAIDAHYFYANGWAMRRITAARPRVHVDIASQVIFVNLLAAALPVMFVDYRPLERTTEGLRPVGANILALPFRDDSIRSLSSLHVAEHIGLVAMAIRWTRGPERRPGNSRACCSRAANFYSPFRSVGLACASTRIASMIRSFSTTSGSSISSNSPPWTIREITSRTRIPVGSRKANMRAASSGSESAKDR